MCFDSKEGDVGWVSYEEAREGDSQEDMDEYEKAKGLHKRYRDEIAALLQEDDWVRQWCLFRTFTNH